MKGLIKALKIIAIVLNAIFLAVILLVVSGTGADPQNLRDWAAFILLFALPPVTLITIALTFHKKSVILTFVLKIIAMIVNASFLVILICETVIGHVNLEGSWMLLFVFMVFLPVINVVAVALMYRTGRADLTN